MPLDFEDHTDVSGVSPPVRARSPAQVHGDTAQKVNQNRRGPQPRQQQGGIGGFFSGLGSKAHELAGDVGGAGKEVGDVLGGLPRGHFDIHKPMDWPGEFVQDAGSAWGLAHDLYSHYRAWTDPGFISSSIQQHWTIDDARVRNEPLWRKALDWGLLEAERSVFENPMLPALSIPTAIQQARGEPEQKAMADVAGQAVSAASDPLTYLSPETKAAQSAAFIGVPAAEAVLGSNPDEQHANLLWASLAAMMLGRGHLPASVRKMLGDRFGNWNEVEKQVTDAVGKREESAKAAADPGAEHKLLTDHVQNQLDAVERMKEGEHIPFDLRPTMPGEVLRDPHAAIGQMGDKEAGTGHLRALNAVIDEINSDLWAVHGNPHEQILRALAGHARSGDAVWDMYFDTASKMLGGKVSKARDVLMGRAAEGSQEAYDELTSEEKLMADSWGHVRSALRQQSADTGQAENFVANWMPRLDELTGELRGRGRPSKGALLERERRMHRAVEEFFDPVTGTVRTEQKYKTVQESNKALQLARQQKIDNLLNGTQLDRDLENDPEAAEIRRLRGVDFAQSEERAKRLAADRFPLKQEGLLANISRAARFQHKAILSQKAINELKKTIIEADHPAGGKVKRVAVIQPAPGRQTEEMLRQGYERVADPRFRGVLVDRGVNDILQRYMKTDFQLPGALEQAAKLNRQLLRLTMFSPHIHGANIARRMGAAGIMNPLSMLHYLQEGKALLPAQQDEASLARRMEAWRAGVQTPRSTKGWQSAFTDQMDAALGHAGDDLQALDATNKKGKLLQTLAAPLHGYHAYENGFWKWVSDFGVAMYHIEKQNGLRQGRGEAEAIAWAARRANSWMGMVLPEDANPLTTKLSKLALFAPNWWRTMGELMVPVYKRSGVFENDRAVTLAVRQALKTAAAMYALSHVGGNLLNYALSGHLQSGNQPGSQDKIEVTNPWLLNRLNDLGLLPQGVDPNTGLNRTTGARMTMQSPYGGQLHDVEQALGEQSGQEGRRLGPGIKAGPVDLQLSVPSNPLDVEDGMTRFAAARLSPLLGTTAALGNVDLYGSLTQGMQPRAIVPGQEPAHVTPWSLAYAALYALPGGSAFAQSIQRNVQQNGTDTASLFGTQVPRSAQAWTQDLKAAGARTAISGLLGVNPPYATAQKTRGVPLSDADYTKVRELTDQYDKQQMALSAETLAGQKTPYQWRQAYTDQSRQHAAQMQALFHNAPEYVNGGDGLASKWNQLYDQATGPDGTVNHTQLAQLQAKFRSEHTPEEMRNMQTVLTKNKNKYPMLAFYHATLDAYDKFQEQWAAQHGLDVTTLRSDLDQYNALHGQAAEQRHFLSKHSELNRYRRDIKTKFDRTPAGLAYSLFHGQSDKLMRQMKAKHLSVQSLEQEVEAAA